MLVGVGNVGATLMNLNHKKVFLRSPLVDAVSKESQDLVHLMVKVIGYDVDLYEEHSGMNPLAKAVSLKYKVKIKPNFHFQHIQKWPTKCQFQLTELTFVIYFGYIMLENIIYILKFLY